MSVAVVTDSTAHLPQGVAERHGIRVVPLHVLVDGAPAADGPELGPDELVEVLRHHRVVTTSRPTPSEFAETFRTELEAGADAGGSLQLSSGLSGWGESGVVAAEGVGAERIRVSDTRGTAMGVGFCRL